LSNVDIHFILLIKFVEMHRSVKYVSHMKGKIRELAICLQMKLFWHSPNIFGEGNFCSQGGYILGLLPVWGYHICYDHILLPGT